MQRERTVRTDALLLHQRYSSAAVENILELVNSPSLTQAAYLPCSNPGRAIKSYRRGHGTTLPVKTSTLSPHRALRALYSDMSRWYGGAVVRVALRPEAQ